MTLWGETVKAGSSRVATLPEDQALVINHLALFDCEEGEKLDLKLAVDDNEYHLATLIDGFCMQETLDLTIPPGTKLCFKALGHGKVDVMGLLEDFGWDDEGSSEDFAEEEEEDGDDDVEETPKIEMLKDEKKKEKPKKEIEKKKEKPKKEIITPKVIPAEEPKKMKGVETPVAKEGRKRPAPETPQTAPKKQKGKGAELCGDCGRTFKSPASLAQHSKDKHEKK